MAITYPITLPTVNFNISPGAIVLQSPDLTPWLLYVDSDGINDGLLHTTDSGVTGTPQAPILQAATGEQWQLDIDNSGVLSTTDTITSLETPRVQRTFVSVTTQRLWRLLVDAGGILMTEPQFDEGVAFSRATFRPFSVVGISASPFTLSQQVHAFQGDLWVFDGSVGPLDHDDAAEWIGALLSLNGMEGTFYLGDPSAPLPRGSVAGAPLVAGASQTGRTLITDGWTPDAANVLKRGDYFQVGSGSTQRLYRTTAAVSADSGGAATIDIWPRLRESPADDEPLITRYPKGVFRLASNEMRWDIEQALLYGIELSAREAR